MYIRTIQFLQVYGKSITKVKIIITMIETGQSNCFFRRSAIISRTSKSKLFSSIITFNNLHLKHKYKQF